jgi:uncharacterized DUF497 family protein
MGKTIISSDGRFEWDEEKDSINQRIHSVSFEQASKTFNDEDRLEFLDKVHSTQDEIRYQVLGLSGNDILFVVDTERDGERIRLISARYATRFERGQYYENKYAQWL